MHAADIRGNLAEQRDWVVAGDDGIRRIVLDAESGVTLKLPDHLQKEAGALRKLRCGPLAVFKMVLKTELDAVLLGDGVRAARSIRTPTEGLVHLRRRHAADR